MFKPMLVALALATSSQALADPTNFATVPIPGAAKNYVDLRAPHALEALQRSNPVHYAKIQKVLAGLEEQPSRVEGDWLQVNFDAHDVDLSRMMVKTSNPPKQVLSFRFDDTRYTMYVARRDMVGDVQLVK